MKSKTQKRAFIVPSLSTWIPHTDDNVEDPGETVMRFGKSKGQKLGDVEKKELRAFKKSYRMGGKAKSVRDTEESKWLWPLLHYFEQFKAKQSGADGDHEIPSAEELNNRRDEPAVFMSSLERDAGIIEEDTTAPYPRDPARDDGTAAGDSDSEVAPPHVTSQAPSKTTKQSRKRKGALDTEEKSASPGPKVKKPRSGTEVMPEAPETVTQTEKTVKIPKQKKKGKKPESSSKNNLEA